MENGEEEMDGIIDDAEANGPFPAFPDRIRFLLRLEKTQKNLHKVSTKFWNAGFVRVWDLPFLW